MIYIKVVGSQGLSKFVFRKPFGTYSLTTCHYMFTWVICLLCTHGCYQYMLSMVSNMYMQARQPIERAFCGDLYNTYIIG